MFCQILVFMLGLSNQYPHFFLMKKGSVSGTYHRCVRSYLNQGEILRHLFLYVASFLK